MGFVLMNIYGVFNSKYVCSLTFCSPELSVWTPNLSRMPQRGRALPAVFRLILWILLSTSVSACDLKAL